MLARKKLKLATETGPAADETEDTQPSFTPTSGVVGVVSPRVGLARMPLTNTGPGGVKRPATSPITTPTKSRTRLAGRKYLQNLGLPNPYAIQPTNFEF